MKKIILCFLFLLLYTSPAFGEDFKISSYQVKIKLLPNSVGNVQETIHVQFTKPLHGIYRKIPYLYKTDSLISQLLIFHIQVPGEKFRTYRNGDNQFIKIGDAAKFATKDKTYTIQYQVYGFREMFKRNPGFYWKIIGPDWETPIENATFQIILPQPGLQSKIVKAYRGFDSLSLVEVTQKANQISGQVKDLEPHESLTMKIPMPQNLFTPPVIFTITNLACQPLDIIYSDVGSYYHVTPQKNS